MRTNNKPNAAWCVLAMAGAIVGCSGEDAGPDETHTVDEVTMIADEGFESPLDVVSSPDGSTFYFTAFALGEEQEAAVFSVLADGSSAVTQMHVGAPLSAPTGLVMSCDGSQLIVADVALALDDEDAEESFGGSLYALPTAGGPLKALEAKGVHEPTGLALSFDCQSLYVTGWTEDGAPALFRLPISGGNAEIVYEGAPLISPTGMYVDTQEVAWVLDHISGPDGAGVLYAITEAGEISSVVEGLNLGAVGGCSLDSAAQTAYMPTLGDSGAVLTTVSLVDGSIKEVDTPGVVDPAGLRTARDAAVFGLVDHEGNAIYRVQ